jgi:hypothetical protein
LTVDCAGGANPLEPISMQHDTDRPEELAALTLARQYLADLENQLYRRQPPLPSGHASQQQGFGRG